MSQVNWTLLFKKSTLSLAEFQTAAMEIAREFSPKSVVALTGSLGAGKTEFVKTVARSRGFTDIASPTFAIHHRYEGQSLSVDHLDLYRLENEDELETTGFWDFFSSSEGLIFIEWPERMDLSHIPYDWDLFHIEIQKKSIVSSQSGVSEEERVLVLSKRA